MNSKKASTVVVLILLIVFILDAQEKIIKDDPPWLPTSPKFSSHSDWEKKLSGSPVTAISLKTR